MDYFDFQKYFKDKYQIKEQIWYMDDTSVVDDTNLEDSAKTLFFAQMGKDVDHGYEILNPDEFAEKIYNALCNRYGDHIIKELFINPPVLGGKYPEIAKKARMSTYGVKGFDLYFTNKWSYSITKGTTLCEGFIYDINKEKLEQLLNINVSYAWAYKDDNKVILIESNRVSYLTDLETIANYVHKPVNDIYNLLYAKEIHNKAKAEEMSEALLSIGLTTIKQKYNLENCSVLFKFNNSEDIGRIYINYLGHYSISIKSTNDEIRYLNYLCHAVKNDNSNFDTLDEAINTLRRYVDKNN